MNVSLSASVLSRYPLPRAREILSRLDGHRIGNAPLAVLERVAVQLTADHGAAVLRWPQLPRAFLLAYFSIVETIPPGDRREAWADLLVRAVSDVLAWEAAQERIASARVA